MWTLKTIAAVLIAILALLFVVFSIGSAVNHNLLDTWKFAGGTGWCVYLFCRIVDERDD